MRLKWFSEDEAGLDKGERGSGNTIPLSHWRCVIREAETVFDVGPQETPRLGKFQAEAFNLLIINVFLSSFNAGSLLLSVFL